MSVVTNRGRTLPATVSIPAQPSPFLTVTPEFSWLPGETYQVQLSGLIDSSGNPVAAAGWTFSIAADGSPTTSRCS